MPAPPENTLFLKKDQRVPQTSQPLNLKGGIVLFTIGLMTKDGVLVQRNG